MSGSAPDKTPQACPELRSTALPKYSGSTASGETPFQVRYHFSPGTSGVGLGALKFKKKKEKLDCILYLLFPKADAG